MMTIINFLNFHLLKKKMLFWALWFYVLRKAHVRTAHQKKKIM